MFNNNNNNKTDNYFIFKRIFRISLLEFVIINNLQHNNMKLRQKRKFQNVVQCSFNELRISSQKLSQSIYDNYFRIVKWTKIYPRHLMLTSLFICWHTFKLCFKLSVVLLDRNDFDKPFCFLTFYLVECLYFVIGVLGFLFFCFFWFDIILLLLITTRLRIIKTILY